MSMPPVSTQGQLKEMHTIDTLFYDGSCPLCSKEIAFLKKHSREDRLRFVDIHHLDLSTANEDFPTKTALLRILHLRKGDLSWLKGVDATVHAWSHLPFGRLLKILRWPLVKPVIDTLYIKWANQRYAKRYQCGPCMGAEE